MYKLPQSFVQCVKITDCIKASYILLTLPLCISGIFETPNPDNVKSLSKPLPLQFICDNIRVPGNLGAILRVAVGAGCEKVLLTKGTYT